MSELESHVSHVMSLGRCFRMGKKHRTNLPLFSLDLLFLRLLIYWGFTQVSPRKRSTNNDFFQITGKVTWKYLYRLFMPLGSTPHPETYMKQSLAQDYYTFLVFQLLNSFICQPASWAGRMVRFNISPTKPTPWDGKPPLKQWVLI